MSFRRDVLDRFGGFNQALGAGTRARGAEETLLFSRVLDQGLRIAYRPAAIVWHRHYAALGEITTQMNALGTALTAYYAALLWDRPARISSLAKLLPQGLRDMSNKRSVMNASMRSDYPSSLVWAHRRGMLRGPFAYLYGELENRLKDRRQR